MANENTLIYHYTTKSALESILSSNKLRLSSCKSYKEENAETNSLKDILIRYMSNHEFREAVCNYARRSAPQSIGQCPIEILTEMRNKTYMACFSNKRDNECLWKKYAENFEGVVIGFSKNHIAPCTDDMTGSEDGVRSPEVRFIDKMLYDEDKFVRRIILSGAGDSPNLVFEIDSYKDASYRDEDESRLCAYIDSAENINKLYYDHPGENGRIIRRFSFSNTIPNNCVELEIISRYPHLQDVDNSHAIKEIFYKTNECKNFIQSLPDIRSQSNEILISELN